jgi:hypothetical protein
MRVDRTRSQFLATAEERATWVAPATVVATPPIPEPTPMQVKLQVHAAFFFLFFCMELFFYYLPTNFF